MNGLVTYDFLLRMPSEHYSLPSTAAAQCCNQGRRCLERIAAKVGVSSSLCLFLGAFADKIRLHGQNFRIGKNFYHLYFVHGYDENIATKLCPSIANYGLPPILL